MKADFLALSKPAGEVEAKVKALSNRRRWTVEKVLISASGATEDLARERYFSRILGLEDLFGD